MAGASASVTRPAASPSRLALEVGVDTGTGVGGARAATGPTRDTDTVRATGRVTAMDTAMDTATERPPAVVRARPHMEEPDLATISIPALGTPIGWRGPRIAPGPDSSRRSRVIERTTSTPTRAATSTVVTTTAAGIGATAAVGRRPTPRMRAPDRRPILAHRRVRSLRPAPRPGHARRPARNLQPDLRQGRARPSAAVPRPDPPRRRARSTATIPPVSVAAHGHTSTRAAGGPTVGRPAGHAVEAGGGDRRRHSYQKGPADDGTFFFLFSKIYRRSSDTPSPSRTLT